MMRAAIIFFLMLMPAKAGVMTGGELQKECNHQVTGVCIAYIIGVLDYEEYLVDGDHLKEPKLCLPAGATPNELIELVASFLDRNQEFWPYSAPSAIYFAINEAYPCGRG